MVFTSKRLFMFLLLCFVFAGLGALNAHADETATVVWVALEAAHPARPALRRIALDYAESEAGGNVAMRFLTEIEQTNLERVAREAILPPDLIIATGQDLVALANQGLLRPWDEGKLGVEYPNYHIVSEVLITSNTMWGQPLCGRMRLLYVNLDAGGTSATQPGSWEKFTRGDVAASVQDSSQLRELALGEFEFDYETWSAVPGRRGLGHDSLEVIGIGYYAHTTCDPEAVRGFVFRLLDQSSILTFWGVGGCFPVRELPGMQGLVSAMRLRGPWLDAMVP